MIRLKHYPYFSYPASEIDLAVPQGCVYERLTKNAPNKLIHEELPISINIEQNNPTQLPFSLQAHLERCKRQYLDFMRHMEVRFSKIKMRFGNIYV